MRNLKEQAQESFQNVEIKELGVQSFPELESASMQDNRADKATVDIDQTNFEFSEDIEFSRILEAIIFASKEPLSKDQLAAYLPDNADVAALLEELQTKYANQGFNLVEHGNGWYFRTAIDLSHILQKDVTEQRKLSRAALEIMAVPC